MKKIKRKSQYTLAELTAGLDVKLQGDPDCPITSVGTLPQAQPGQITFLMNPLYKKYLETTQASAVILLVTDAEVCPCNAIISRDPYFTYAQIAGFFEDKPLAANGIHPTAVISDDCEIDPSASIGPLVSIARGVKIGANVSISAGCVIGEFCEIGDDSALDPNVTLYHRIRIGKRVAIASGVVIGSDGFGLAKHAGVWLKIPQLGRVIIEDDVEIGANTSIDRGAIEDTVIEAGAKLDNQIQVGHNVRIGKNTAIAGCVGIAGSTIIGDNCLIGGGVGIAGHLHIANDVMITGGSAITKTIRQPGIYSSGVGGVMTNAEWRKNSARVHRLEQLMQRVKALENAIEDLIERKAT